MQQSLKRGRSEHEQDDDHHGGVIQSPPTFLDLFSTSTNGKKVLSVGSGNCSFEVSLVVSGGLPLNSEVLERPSRSNDTVDHNSSSGSSGTSSGSTTTSSTNALKYPQHVLDVTVLEPSREEFVRKYARENGEANLLALEALEQRVLFGVDATNLLQTLRHAGQTQRGKLLPLRVHNSAQQGDHASGRGGEQATLLQAISPEQIVPAGQRWVTSQTPCPEFASYPCPVTGVAVQYPTGRMLPPQQVAVPCFRHKAYDVIYWNNPYPIEIQDAVEWGARNNWLQAAMGQFFGCCIELLADKGLVCVTMREEQFAAIKLTDLALHKGFEHAQTLVFLKQDVPHYTESYGDRRVEQANGQSADYVTRTKTMTYVFRWIDDGRGQPVKATLKNFEKRRKLDVNQLPGGGDEGNHSQNFWITRILFGGCNELNKLTYTDTRRALVEMYLQRQRHIARSRTTAAEGATAAAAHQGGAAQQTQTGAAGASRSSTSRELQVSLLYRAKVGLDAYCRNFVKDIAHTPSFVFANYLSIVLFMEGSDLMEGKPCQTTTTAALVRLLNNQKWQKAPDLAPVNLCEPDIGRWSCPKLAFEFYVIEVGSLFSGTRASSTYLGEGVKVAKSQEAPSSEGTWFLRHHEDAGCGVFRFDPRAATVADLPPS